MKLLFLTLDRKHLGDLALLISFFYMWLLVLYEIGVRWIIGLSVYLGDYISSMVQIAFFVVIVGILAGGFVILPVALMLGFWGLIKEKQNKRKSLIASCLGLINLFFYFLLFWTTPK